MYKILLTCVFGIITIKSIYSESLPLNKQPLISQKNLLEIKQNIKWYCLKESLIYVESKGNDSAIGTHQDVGCLQETPIFVKEANRIIGKDSFKLSDRYNREKSLVIFEIIQNHHNPTKNIFKAIKIHNPRAKRDYKDSVMAKYKSLIIKYNI